MTAPKIANPGEVTADNIIRPTFDELPDDHRQAYEAIKNKRQEEINALRKQQQEKLEELQREKEKEDMEAFMATLKKDRQGTITSVGEARLTPLLDDTSVSANMFTADQLAAIDQRISESNHHVYEATVEYVNASKNTLPNINATAANANAGPSA